MKMTVKDVYKTLIDKYWRVRKTRLRGNCEILENDEFDNIL